MSIDVAMQFGKPGEATQQSGGGGGGITFTLLWENQSPTAQFAAQSISIDLSPYKLFYIVWYYSSTNDTNRTENSAIFQVNENSKMLYSVGNNNTTGNRYFTYSNTNKQITFTVARHNNSNNNAYDVPVRIYGINF